MDSFAAVLPKLGYSSMYQTECELMSCADVKCYNSEYECLYLTLFVSLRLKINHVSIGHMCLFFNSAPSQTGKTGKKRISSRGQAAEDRIAVEKKLDMRQDKRGMLKEDR
jgi:hypothetical protein